MLLRGEDFSTTFPSWNVLHIQNSPKVALYEQGCECVKEFYQEMEEKAGLFI
jgi:hypothetical protein